MLKRVFALSAILVALPAVLLQAQDLFVLPGYGTSSGQVQALVTNPLTTFRTFSAGPGSFALLPNLDASKYFVVASSISNTILSTDATFLTPSLVANLSTVPTQAIITPDGKLLAVAAGTLHLYNTQSNAELVQGGFSQGVNVNTFAVAASLDSTVLFALGSTGIGTSQLTAINSTTLAPIASMPLSLPATAVSVGPNGLLYVSLPNQILEIDPRTLQPTFNGTIAVSGTPGQLVFTPDGLYAVGANSSGFGNGIIIVTLATHTSSNPGIGINELTNLQVAGVDTILALSAEDLYEITVSPLSVNRITSLSGLIGMATTNDVPTTSHATVDSVFLISASTLYQYTLATQGMLSKTVAPNITPGAVAYEVPAKTTANSHPTTLLSYGANQTILPSAISEPLVVQVLDVNNLPISGYDVHFQTSASGVSLSTTSAITGSNGYALTYLTASDAPGTVTVTATAANLTASFPVVVSETAHGGGGPTLSIIAGQGQLLTQDTNTANPGSGSALQVLASDANGNPISGIPVTFSVPSSEGTLEGANGGGAATQVVNTDANGVAFVNFLSTGLSLNDQTQGFLQSLVTASAPNTNAVTFYITTVISAYVYPLVPAPGSRLIGAEGSTLAGALKMQVVSPRGLGIPNVSLTMNDGDADPTMVPTVNCNGTGGLVLTNSTGIATCDATFGPRIGQGKVTPIIGYTRTPWGELPLTVTAGPPSIVQITQGNNQTGTPGQRLPLALLVHVTDSGGNKITGQAVTWNVVTAGAVTLSNVVSTTDSNGNASALATLGSVAGIAQVTVTAGTASATFNLTVNIPSVGIQKVSGDQQTATVNIAFTSPLVVKVVDSSGAGVTGAPVSFQVTSGAATLGTSSTITDSTGQASTTVTAGATAGAITVSAASAAFSVTFTLTAIPVGPSNITIINGASFNPNTGISPGGIATIRGNGILSGVQGLLPAANSAGELPLTFSGVTITFNGTAAPIYYVQSIDGQDQVSVQVPLEVQPGPAVALGVNVANENPVSIMVPVKPLAPGIFTSVYGEKTYAVAVRPDGSQVSPTNPAQRGENLQLYVTGLGQATPPIATGAFGVPNQTMLSRLVVGLNNGGVPLISAVYGPGLIGIYVVTLQVPADTPTGPYQPIGVIAYDSSNKAYFAQATYIPIE